MKRILLFCTIAAAFLSSCNGDKIRDKMIPQITGKAGEVVCVIEDHLWNYSADTMLSIFCQEVPGLPQVEPMFNLIHIPSNAFTQIFQRHRNIISCRIKADTVASVNVAHDVWAKPQIFIQITAPNNDEFVRLMLEYQEEITGLLLKAEQDRIVQNYTNFPDREVISKLEKAAGISLTIPKGYTFDMDTNNFVWISHETPEISQGIFVYYYDYTDTATFTRNYLINKRNELLKLYVGGPSEGSYMTTVEFEDVTRFRSYMLKGTYTAELRGLWETRGDYMGGPFVSLSQIDTLRNRVVTVDGYVYAGKKSKRNYMRQVETILQSITFTNNK